MSNALATAPSALTRPARWDKVADVVVVGFGAAGAAAAIEAAERGVSVIALDRFSGGGATAISGGVFYAGGGTAIQQQAGVTDSVDAMFEYLRLEVGDVVSTEVLHEFCAASVDNLEWLRKHGVPFDASLCPVKTSYPSDDYFLYYSGNESFSPYRDVAKPAARGHRAKGKGLPGANFYAPLHTAALGAAVDLITEARVTELVVEDGAVIGVRVSRIVSPLARWRHRQMAALATKINPYSPGTAKKLRAAIAKLERNAGTSFTVQARAGVILSTGGFIYNREMVAANAPNYRPGMPLGTMGCNGDGIRMGQAVGAATDHMDRVSAWRFINPPEAFVRGILVDRAGRRIANERLYGAQIGRKMVETHSGEAILIIDKSLFDLARAQCKRSTGIHWFQRAPALINLYANRRTGASLAELADAAKIDPAQLQETVQRYNAAARGEVPDELGKEAEFLHELKAGPFFAIDCGLRSRRFPCPTLTLGGLRVDEATGRVLRDDQTPIAGLYAAGRTAVGVCSNDYVSGLSLADCVFSGRRAGASASATAA